MSEQLEGKEDEQPIKQSSNQATTNDQDSIKELPSEKEEPTNLQAHTQSIKEQPKQQSNLEPTINKETDGTKGKKQKGSKGSKGDDGVLVTNTEFKQMSKKVIQFDNMKAESLKLVKNYDLVKEERDQLKSLLQDKSKTEQQLTLDLDIKQQELANIKLTNEKVILDLNSQNKKIDQLKKEAQAQTIKIEELKREVETQNKRLQELKKTQHINEGLLQKVKQLQMIIDITTKNGEQQKKVEEKLRKDEEKQKEFLKLQKENNNNLRNEVAKLRVVESQTFVLKQELLRITNDNKQLKAEKEQLPIMVDKFEHQEQIINELKENIKEQQKAVTNAKILNDKLQKRIEQLLEEKKQIQKKHNKARCQLEEAIGETEALKAQLDEERGQWEVQKKRYTTEIKGLKTELHNQHQKLKITDWELSQSRKREKRTIQMERVNVMSLSKQELLVYLQEMEMKDQSLKLTINSISHTLHEKDERIKEQQAALMALARSITSDYPDLQESQGMPYLERQIIQMGKLKKDDWANIVEKVMIQNLRLKYSVTALGQEYNQQLRKDKQK